MSRSDDQLMDWIKSLNTKDELPQPGWHATPTKKLASKIVDLARKAAEEKYAMKKESHKRASAALEAAAKDAQTVIDRYRPTEQVTGYVNTLGDFV